MLIDWPFKITPFYSMNNTPYRTRMEWISECVKANLRQLENK